MKDELLISNGTSSDGSIPHESIPLEEEIGESEIDRIMTRVSDHIVKCDLVMLEVFFLGI